MENNANDEIEVGVEQFWNLDAGRKVYLGGGTMMVGGLVLPLVAGCGGLRWMDGIGAGFQARDNSCSMYRAEVPI